MTAPWMKQPRRVVPSDPAPTRPEQVHPWDVQRLLTNPDAQHANDADACARQHVGHREADPTYCCETCELLTELVGRVRALEAAVNELRAGLEARR